jgi:hypothetical protein
MCNKEQLIGYLYDELPAADRAVFEAHLAACAECRQEVGGLRQTRQHLTTWSPPEPEFNFRIVREAPASRRRWSFVPQWALAAAASLLVIAGAAAIANLEVRYDAEGVVVRTGWTSAPAAENSAPSAAPAMASTAVAQPASSDGLKAEFASLVRRLEELERAQAKGVVKAGASTAPAITAAELRKILTAMEARQRLETAALIQHVWNDFNAARASDLVRVQNTFAPELQRQQRSIDYIYQRTAAQQHK